MRLFGKKQQSFILFLIFSFFSAWGQEDSAVLKSENTPHLPLPVVATSQLSPPASLTATDSGGNLSVEDEILPEPEDEQNIVNPTEESQIEDHLVEENHVQDSETKDAEGAADSKDERATKNTSVQTPEIKSITSATHQEVLKTYIPIQQLIWNDADTLISYLEEDVVYLVDSSSHAIVGAVEFPGVLDYSMFIEEDGMVHVIAGSADGTIAVWDIPYNPDEEPLPTREFEPHFMNSVPDGRGIDLLAFSDDSNYIAEFHEATGELGLHYKLRYTNELISKSAAATVANVYSMAFSDDNSQLATATQDGKLFIWNAFNGRFMYEHDIYTQSRVPVHFIQGTYNLLVASAENTVVVLDPVGNVLQSITTSSPVVDTKMLSDKRRVAILTQDNRIEIYNLEDGVYLGYVPSFNITAITSFDFNSTDTSMVVGHEDGSIYKIDLETNVLPPRTRPVLRLIGVDEVLVEGEEFTPEIPPAEYSDTMPEESIITVADPGLFPAPGHGIEILAGVSMLPNPHMVDIDFTVGYLNSFLIYPFYVGGQLISSVGFPNKEFPYNYRLYGEPLAPPLMISVALDFPVGIAITPFENFRDLQIYAEVGVGFALHQLWNRRFGQTAIAGLLHPSFVASMAVGAGWKGITLRLHGDYDARLGFLFSANIGYTIQLPYKKKANSGKIRVKDEPKETRSEENTDVVGGNATAEDVAEGDVGNQNEGEGLSKGGIF